MTRGSRTRRPRFRGPPLLTRHPIRRRLIRWIRYVVRIPSIAHEVNANLPRMICCVQQSGSSPARAVCHRSRFDGVSIFGIVNRQLACAGTVERPETRSRGPTARARIGPCADPLPHLPRHRSTQSTGSRAEFRPFRRCRSLQLALYRSGMPGQAGGIFDAIESRCLGKSK
jgi:hypothetical protein